MAAWYDTLGQLTGEEIYHLAGQLRRAHNACSIAATDRRRRVTYRAAAGEVLGDLDALADDVAAQAARITIPMTEAQGIIWRARFARGHPVRMVPPS